MTAKLDSQSDEGAKLDWRAMQGANLDIQPYKLPTFIENKLHNLMDKLGIVFGSFDLIVTPDDDYIFLEVNEQGQFLWIEELNPDFKMLDIFINFIINKSKSFKWNSNNCAHSIEKYITKIQDQFKQNMERHVYLNGAIVN